MPRAVRLLLVVTLVVCAAAAGFRLTHALAPERLQTEVEGWLSEATNAPAEVATLRFVLGFPIRLEGTGVRLYDGSLTVEKASARIDVLSLLFGRPRFTWLRLDGAHLQVDRTPEGEWSPPLFGEPEPPAHDEPALAPLRVIEGVTRSLLSRPLLADTLIVRRSRVSLLHPSPSGVGAPVSLVFQSVNGRLRHSRLFGDARLFLRVRVESEGRERGRLEWQGTRDENGAMRATMAATGLDLAILAPYARSARPKARLAGTLDGVADFQTAEPGVGSLELDLAVRDLATSLAHSVEPEEPLRVSELTLRMGVGLDHRRVVLSKARIGTGDLDFAFDAEIERPLRNASDARVTLSLEELELKRDTARTIAGWLPASMEERVISLADRLRSGLLHHIEISGDATVERWRSVITGGLERLPAGLSFAARFEHVSIDVDEANRLEDLRAELGYRDDTLVISEAAGTLNGGPLPELSIHFGGVSKVLAARLHRREMTSSAEALVGLTPLFEFFRREPDPDEPRRTPPSVHLRFDQVHHPALLWPLRDVQVQVVLQPDADGVLMQLERSAWAGVLLDGEVDWTLRPTRRLDLRLTASEPAASDPILAAPPPLEDPASAASGPSALGALVPPSPGRPLVRPWAEGSFRVGAIDSPRWAQQSARGRFSASGGTLRIEDVRIDLEPRGTLSGWADLDLTERERVPYRADARVDGADLKSWIAQRGASAEFVTGRVDARGNLRGTLVPGQPLLHDANGSAKLAASDGTIQRSVPPVFALALASKSLNPFSRRDELRYANATSDLSFEAGRLSTQALDIEGPDVRLFVSGSLDLSRSPHEVDAELVLFLFRQVDRALELIPILNVLLLGENDNLIAAYFQLTGTWEKPDVRSKPLRTLEEGPGSVLTKTIPRAMLRGMKTIGGLFQGSADETETEAETEAAPATGAEESADASPDPAGPAPVPAPAPAPADGADAAVAP